MISAFAPRCTQPKKDHEEKTGEIIAISPDKKSSA
jgi:hypothetical protein